METELDVDEVALTDFFGVLPEEQDPDEKEFFGSTIYKVTRGDLSLSVCFRSAPRNDMSLALASIKSGQEVLSADINQLVELRVRGKFLLVMTKDQKGTALDPKETASITLDPVKVVINASRQAKDE